jgi:tRNA A-37 threonylcarbamoyl transferase component Bud32/tetratricopeptide (TPR) repeat protein
LSPSASLLSGEVAERYVIEEQIGHGGTSIVYRARDRVRGMVVAIKVLREDATRNIDLERFRFEIRQLSTLSHPNIVPVLDSGEVEGRPYFVLPFLEGGTLREKLRKDKQLPFDEVIAIGVTIARALEFAHSHGIIHRDVKPENILFSEGQVCLADFGTARHLEHRAGDPTTSTGMVPGTAAYMSPEQASGEREYDGRTDIYSLACVLYECVAGMQPFVGPTMQAVISQRLSHPPRPVSVYRPSVPGELEQVLVKATAMAPADRFAGAGDFASALERARVATTDRPSIGARTVRARRLVVSGALTVAAVVAVALTAKSRGWNPFADRIAIDTTRVAILPVETTGGMDPVAGQELLTEGLRAWSGVSAVETFSMNDALRHRGRGAGPAQAALGLSLDDAAEVVLGLGAGRFIRSRLTEASGLRGVYAALYDAESQRELYHARLPLPDDSSLWPRVFASLTDSLVLRGAAGTGRDRAQLARLNLVSYQLFLRGREALNEWDLAAADSLFGASAQLDSLNTRAMFWGAQVRAWRNRGPSTWAKSAGLAAGDSIGLAPSERSQARALALLGISDLEGARRLYRDLTRTNPYDFGAWFGLATTYRLDRLVLRDSTSPSGYRFRGSYEQAIQSYARAYELLPSAHRSVESGGFELLRVWLFTINTLRAGSLNGEQPYTFYAKISLDHDTAVLVPYLRNPTMAGPPQLDPLVVGRALTRNRRIFQRVVSSWRESFPAAVGTREAIAISLEMLGDPAAADSFLAIRRTGAGTPQLRLAVEEAVARLKVALSEHPDQVESSRALADSIVENSAAANTDEVELLSRLTIVTGRCATTAGLAHRLKRSPEFLQLPPTVVERANDAFARWASGCGGAETFPAITTEAMRLGIPEREARIGEYDLLGAPIAMEYPATQAAIRRLASANDYIIAAEIKLLDGDTTSARQLIGRYRSGRLSAPAGDLVPDAVLIEARLWIAMGDTATAKAMLDKLLSELRYSQPVAPGAVIPNMLRFGAIGPAIELRAQISHDEASKRWALVLKTLWAKADAPARARADRLVRFQGTK